MNTTYYELLKLPLAEKLRLVEALWDSIAANPYELPFTEHQVEELGRRKQEYLRNPEIGLSWEAVKANIRAENG